MQQAPQGRERPARTGHRDRFFVDARFRPRAITTPISSTGAPARLVGQKRLEFAPLAVDFGARRAGGDARVPANSLAFGARLFRSRRGVPRARARVPRASLLRQIGAHLVDQPRRCTREFCNAACEALVRRRPRTAQRVGRPAGSAKRARRSRTRWRSVEERERRARAREFIARRAAFGIELAQAAVRIGTRPRSRNASRASSEDSPVPSRRAGRRFGTAVRPDRRCPAQHARLRQELPRLR